MAVVVETGEGLPDAESYASPAEVSTFATGRPEAAAWAGASAAQQDAALRQATTYLDGTYDWVGSIAHQTQALDWPRVGGYDGEGRPISSTSVPRQVKDACCLLATSAIGVSLQPEPSTTATGGGVVKRKKVAVLEVEYFDPGGSTISRRSFPEVSTMLAGLHTGGGGGSIGRVVRYA